MSQSLKHGSYLRTTNPLNKWIGIRFTNCLPFLRFLLVGVLNTFIGMGLMLLLKNGLEWSYWQATFTGNTVGASVSFLLNRRFTFRSQVPIMVGASKFIFIVLASYFVSFSLSHSLTKMLNSADIYLRFMDLDNIAIFLGSIIYTITNFFGQKLFVFKENKNCSS
ncbi:GtrA family protein [Mesobacillus jeotgali]|uniref:GtrA family protein n=1 Tax=Mesobacillus jeotgali TaxID=129985 RepID=UPI0009A75E0B|nr:GtrA family protein [Mesobacillus jeotgali]